MVTICTSRLNIHKLCILSAQYVSHRKAAVISLSSVNRFVFLIDAQLFPVR
jgi:hypothetical protein